MVGMDKISILLEHLLMNTRSNPVTWFEIYVEDLTRAKAFYETVFGCTLLPEMTDGSFEAFRFPGGMPGNGAMGALMKHAMRKPSREGTMVYFHCSDCNIPLELAKKNGPLVKMVSLPSWETVKATPLVCTHFIKSG